MLISWNQSLSESYQTFGLGAFMIPLFLAIRFISYSGVLELFNLPSRWEIQVVKFESFIDSEGLQILRIYHDYSEVLGNL